MECKKWTQYHSLNKKKRKLFLKKREKKIRYIKYKFPYRQDTAIRILIILEIRTRIPYKMTLEYCSLWKWTRSSLSNSRFFIRIFPGNIKNDPESYIMPKFTEILRCLWMTDSSAISNASFSTFIRWFVRSFTD